jgi:Sulfatase-modifying factor enzyme 1
MARPGARGRALAAIAVGLTVAAIAFFLPEIQEPTGSLARAPRPPHVVVVPQVEAARPEDARAVSDCPEAMLLVDGIYCPFVGHRCLEWIDEERDRCRVYDARPLCEGRKVNKRFCIDRFEYPNQAGVRPAVMVDFIQAAAACKAEGKRLCTESEWTFACEGVEQRPYPYGNVRDPSACNIDRHYRDPDFEAFSDPLRVSEEVSRLDQRVPSGSMPRCVSPFGVLDMTGNVDEWVQNEDPRTDAGEDISGLKGGYWGPIRARCRPITNSHNRWFRFYQVGFRCCADASAAAGD